MGAAPPSSTASSLMLLQSILTIPVVDSPLLRVRKGFVGCRCNYISRMKCHLQERPAYLQMHVEKKDGEEKAPAVISENFFAAVSFSALLPLTLSCRCTCLVASRKRHWLSVHLSVYTACRVWGLGSPPGGTSAPASCTLFLSVIRLRLSPLGVCHSSPACTQQTLVMHTQATAFRLCAPLLSSPAEFLAKSGAAPGNDVEWKS